MVVVRLTNGTVGYTSVSCPLESLYGAWEMGYSGGNSRAESGDRLGQSSSEQGYSQLRIGTHPIFEGHRSEKHTTVSGFFQSLFPVDCRKARASDKRTPRIERDAAQYSYRRVSLPLPPDLRYRSILRSHNQSVIWHGYGERRLSSCAGVVGANRVHKEGSVAPAQPL